MTCRELIEFLMDYTSGGLPPADRQKFERHLAACPACRAYLDNYLKTIEMSPAAFVESDEEVPADVPEELVRAILEARRRG